MCSLHIVRQGSQCTRSSRQSLHWALALQDVAGLARPTALCSTEPGKSMNIPFFPFIYSNFNRLHTRSSALSFYPAICNRCKTFKVDFHFPRHHSCLLTVVKCSLLQPFSFLSHVSKFYGESVHLQKMQQLCSFGAGLRGFNLQADNAGGQGICSGQAAHRNKRGHTVMWTHRTIQFNFYLVQFYTWKS